MKLTMEMLTGKTYVYTGGDGSWRFEVDGQKGILEGNTPPWPFDQFWRVYEFAALPRVISAIQLPGGWKFTYKDCDDKKVELTFPPPQS